MSQKKLHILILLIVSVFSHQEIIAQLPLDTIELSTDENTVWYFIASAKPEYENKGITDVVHQGAEIKFSLETIAKDNDNQQWKAVRKTNASPGEKRIQFINKATGNLIQTNSVYNNYFYFTQFTDSQEDSNGWNTRYLGDGQFEIYGVENDGVTRYLSASSKDQQRPDLLLEGSTKDTGFAWFLKKVDDFSGLNKGLPDLVRIYSKNKRILVEGSRDYIIRNLQGIQISRTRDLTPGIYLVTVNEKTSKIFVK